MILSSELNFIGNSNINKVYYNDKMIHGRIKHDIVLMSPGQADLTYNDWFLCSGNIWKGIVSLLSFLS